MTKYLNNQIEVYQIHLSQYTNREFQLIFTIDVVNSSLTFLCYYFYILVRAQQKNKRKKEVPATELRNFNAVKSDPSSVKIENGSDST